MAERELTGDAEPGTRPRSKWVTWIIFGLTICLFLAVVVFVGRTMIVAYVYKTPYTGREGIRFTRDAWLAAVDDREGARYLMVEDLLAEESIVGCTRTDLESLLGPLIPHVGGNWCYYLGPEPSLASVDSIWLGIEFGASDRVMAAHTFTD